MGAGFSIKAKANAAAEILIYEDVGAGWFGGVTAKQFADDLKALGDVKTIDVRLNSYGGDVFDGLAIYNQLVQHKARVTTHVDGVAASIASIIAMAGEEIRIAENGWLMIHDAWGMAIGNADEMRRQADLLESVTDQLAGIYVARTGKDKEYVRGLMREETWLDAGRAIDDGFATAMDENLRMAAHGAAPDRFKFRHLPTALGGAAPAAAPAAPAAPAAAGSADTDRALRAKVNEYAERFARRRQLNQHKSRGAG